MKLCMFRTVPLSTIRRFSLYIQQWYMSYRCADSLQAESGCPSLHVLDSSCVHHQGFFTVHTAVVYAIQVWGQLANRIRMFHSTCFRQFLCPSSGVFHWNVLILLASCPQTCMTYHCCVYSEKLLMRDRGTARNM